MKPPVYWWYSFRERHLLKKTPMTVVNYYHHSEIYAGYFVGNVIAGYVFIDEIGSMFTAYSGQYYRHDRVCYQSYTKPEQCSTGIAQCVDFRIQILF